MARIRLVLGWAVAIVIALSPVWLAPFGLGPVLALVWAFDVAVIVALQLTGGALPRGLLPVLFSWLLTHINTVGMVCGCDDLCGGNDEAIHPPFQTDHLLCRIAGVR